MGNHIWHFEPEVTEEQTYIEMLRDHALEEAMFSRYSDNDEYHHVLSADNEYQQWLDEMNDWRD